MPILPTRRELKRTSFAGVLNILINFKKMKEEKGKGRYIYIYTNSLPHTELESDEKLHWSVVWRVSLISAQIKFSNQVFSDMTGFKECRPHMQWIPSPTHQALKNWFLCAVKLHTSRDYLAENLQWTSVSNWHKSSSILSHPQSLLTGDFSTSEE